MGKIKERRFRYHKKLVKDSILDTKKNADQVLEVDESAETPGTSLTPDFDVFKGIEINVDTLTGFDKNLDCKSESGKSRRELKIAEKGLTKKEKILKRRERFLLKMETMHPEKKSKKKKKKKKKGVLDGDMMPLLESLPVLENKPAKKPTARVSMKARKRIRETSKDVKFFKFVLADPTFAKNPSQTIIQILKQRMAEKRPNFQFNE